MLLASCGLSGIRLPLILAALLLMSLLLQVVFISPAHIAGVGFGTVIGSCLPSWMITILLNTVLVASQEAP